MNVHFQPGKRSGNMKKTSSFLEVLLIQQTGDSNESRIRQPTSQTGRAGRAGAGSAAGSIGVLRQSGRASSLGGATLAKRCPSGADEGAGCFSDAQLAAVNAAHTGYTFHFARANGVMSYAGFGYGGEGLSGSWDRWMAGTVAPTAGADATGVSQLYLYGNYYVRYFIARNRNFNPLTYDPDNFRERVLEVSNLMDGTDPDLSAFFKRGGKLILREDISDTAQSPLTGLDYWDAVVAKMGRQTVDEFFAAYVATGLPHTSGGINAGAGNAPSDGIPGRVDLLAVLDNWVEKGSRPADLHVLANRKALPPYEVEASRPMCRYGSYPKYVGSGSAGGNLAENYTCAPN